MAQLPWSSTHTPPDPDSVWVSGAPVLDDDVASVVEEVDVVVAVVVEVVVEVVVGPAVEELAVLVLVPALEVGPVAVGLEVAVVPV